MTGPGKRTNPAVILGALAVTNVIGYAARNALFTVYPDLRDRFAIHDTKLGLLTTAFIIPHAIATLPFGWAGDRYDRRRVIAFGIVLAAIAGAAGAFARTTFELAVSRAFVGLGTAAIVPVANSILTQLYEGPKKASRLSIFNLGLLFGGVLGFGVGIAVGFPKVVVLLAVPSVLCALLVLTLPIPAHPAPHDRVSLVRYLTQLGKLFYTESLQLLRIRTLRWLVLSTTAMAFAAGGYNAWLIDFLERDKGMSEGAASTLLVIASFGAVAGILFGARLADRMRRKKRAGRLWIIALGMGCTLPCAIAAIEVAPGPGLYLAGIGTMFFISWYHAPMAASVDDLAPPARAVAAQALVIFTMHLLGTASSSYVVGAVSDASSLYVAMYVPTGALVIAALAMIAATSSFAIDSIAARGTDESRGYAPTDSMQ